MSSRPAKRRPATAASRPNRDRPALSPQRSVGRKRVANLMIAAADVIRERGFDAATMAEIAERAGAKVGSLYRFFPSKEVLADALMQRYADLIDTACDEIDARLSALTVDELADLFVNFLVRIHHESGALTALLEARSHWSAKRLEFREQALKRVANTLLLRAPGLPRKTARDMAVVLLNNMKTMVAMTVDKSAPTSPGSADELSLMNRLYLASKLAGFKR
ncbi:TetR/AcrR family transcriptional regulator [Bradyrhizobium canariense]|uniref:Transcriptional regulator, TetR family n=1 Tax=Bradyrhizobium canariense TaxID=255045 RepID=A0A1H1P008_9BRAD|nr:TetR/AcrR family transcriptional regulator [Bradyrhizobium canariense]SDS04533.1 transcriptional regulator, TetR family [Bradyrhizobium canariense]